MSDADNGLLCQWVGRDGTLCNSPGSLVQNTPTGPWCRAHDPDRRIEMVESGRKGGEARIAQKRAEEEKPIAPADAPAAPETLEDIAANLRFIARASLTGDLGVRRAQVATAALRELRPVLEKLDLDRRVAALEAEVREQKSPGRRRPSIA